MTVIFKIVFVQTYGSQFFFFIYVFMFGYLLYTFYKWDCFPFCNSGLTPLEGRRSQRYFNFLSVFSAFIRSINYSCLRPRRPWLYSTDAINFACFCFLYCECDTLLLTTLGNVERLSSFFRRLCVFKVSWAHDTENFQIPLIKIPERGSANTGNHASQK